MKKMTNKLLVLAVGVTMLAIPTVGNACNAFGMANASSYKYCNGRHQRTKNGDNWCNKCQKICR